MAIMSLCDNFFTSLDVAQRLAEQKCSINGTARQNRRELQQAAKRQQQQHETSLFTFTQTAVVTLTSYQCEKQKSVVIMSTLHPDVEISSHNNPKKKPDTVLFYNRTKLGLTSLIRWPGNTLQRLRAEGGPFTYFIVLLI